MAALVKTIALAASLLGVACSIDSQGEVSLPPVGSASFTDIQTFVGSGCGSLDCHGDPGRPLRIYSVYGLRLTVDLRTQSTIPASAPNPITTGEMARNSTSFAAFSLDLPIDQHRALAKPLSEEAGGMAHKGGDLWPSKEAPEYLCLRAWLDGAQDADACAQAAAAAPF